MPFDPTLPDPPVATPDPPGGTNPWDDPLNMAYKQYIGRTPTGAELATHYGNPGGLAGAFSTIKNSPEALAFAKGQGGPAPTTPPVSGGNSTDPVAMIDSLYKNAGITDGGRGSGFADRAYWLEHPSEILNGRLGKDLAGTGTDQPTGTPGQGSWSTSGASDRANGGGGSAIGGLMAPNFAVPAPTTGYGPSLNTPNAFWNSPSPSQFGLAGQAVPQSPLATDTTSLLQQLLSRIQLPSSGSQSNQAK